MSSSSSNLSSASKHKTDALGNRDLDSESKNPKFSTESKTSSDATSIDDPATTNQSGSNESDIPDINRAANVSTPAPVQASILISTVRPNLFLNEIRLNSKSTYIPSARALFRCTEEMLSRFSRMKGFAQTYADICTPPAIKCAISIIFYYRVLKVMSQQGLTNVDMENCIFKIESSYPETQFVIPSPLVPFFQAICAFQPIDERFGLVCPVLPETPGATAANHGALRSNIIGLLPNFTSILNQCAHVSQTLPSTNPNNLDYEADVDVPAPTIPVPASPTAAGLNSWKHVDVGSQPIPNSLYSNSYKRMDIQRATGGINPFPLPFADATKRTDDEVNSWLTYLKLSGRIDWIGSALEALDVFSIPFEKNVSLNVLPSIDGSYASVTYHYDNMGVAYPDTNTARNAATPRLSLHCTGVLNEPLADSNTGRRANGGITRLEAEISALTQLNVILPANYYGGSDAVGTYLATRKGPYFNPAHLKQYAYIPGFNVEDLLRSTIQLSLATARLDQRS